MTEPVQPEAPLAASTAERLAALRQPSTSKKRTAPALTSKVLSAGISTTALFGLVAAMGWPASTATTQVSQPVATPTTQIAVATPVAPTVAPLVPATPAPVPADAVPTTIPVAIPAAQPAPQIPAQPIESNTTTQASD